MDIEHFNLVDEPWIRTVALDGSERTYGLKDLFLNAHELSFLAGETELQNVAVLRLLVAISVTVMYRYDSNGSKNSLSDRKEAITRFRKLWNQGKYSYGIIEYFETWHNRFDLLDEEYPFYQVPGKYRKQISVKPDSKNKTGISYSVASYGEADKLGWIGATAVNGEILQSGNTVSPFSTKSKLDYYKMTMAETARWLIYYMTFADCSSKIPGKWNAGMTFASSGALIHPIGKTLFETIMLCSVLLNHNEKIYPKVSPAWELDGYTGINASPYGEAIPDNLPELYTQQSRKVVVHRCENNIDGIFVAAGDRYGTVNAFLEPMFAFHPDKTDKTGSTLKPNHLRENEMGWKAFEAVLGNVNNIHSKPSRWTELLFDEEILPDDLSIPYIMTDISYGSMACGVAYTVNTSVVINKKFFKDDALLQKSKTEAERISSISTALRQLGISIDLAYGAKRSKTGGLEATIGDRLQREYEVAIGKVFSLLLANKIQMEELREKEFQLAEKTANNVLKSINLLGYMGHGDDVSIGKAEIWFHNKLYGIKKECGLMGGDTNE